MKILQTADWHLGHSLHGIGREYEHQCFLRWLLEQLEQCEADALIIAGDIFDSANPPASAQTTLYDFLLQARQRRPLLDIVLIGGNHDSAARLDAPAQILQSLGITVVGGLTRVNNGNIDWQRLIVPLKDNTGVVRAICGAMPFIRNSDLPLISDVERRAESDKDKDPLISSVARLYQQLSQQMQQYIVEQALNEPITQIVTGHCYMVGTELSELSERRILGGNQHALPASIFAQAVDYAALGHLHKAQRVNSSNKTQIRYSGSPIPLSFSEKNYPHQILQIELGVETQADADAHIRVESILIPRVVDIQVLPEQGYATLAELETLISEQGYTELQDEQNPVLDKAEYPMLEVRAELDKPEPALRQKIETLLENKAVRLLKISTRYPGKGESLAEQKQQTRLEELHPEDVFQRCYQRSFAQQAPEDLSALFHHLLESVEVDE